jgi:hypothetical protein
LPQFSFFLYLFTSLLFALFFLLFLQ